LINLFIWLAYRNTDVPIAPPQVLKNFFIYIGIAFPILGFIFGLILSKLV